jgi:hypothetical protein
MWFGGTSGYCKKQLDLSNYVPTKNLDKEQNENFCKAPLDCVDLAIGKFCCYTIRLVFPHLPRIVGIVGPMTNYSLIRVHGK